MKNFDREMNFCQNELSLSKENYLAFVNDNRNNSCESETTTSPSAFSHSTESRIRNRQSDNRSELTYSSSVLDDRIQFPEYDFTSENSRLRFHFQDLHLKFLKSISKI